jgi:hypothetical protein
MSGVEHMKRVQKYFDPGSFIVIMITFILFIAALFTKGFTHDLFLEAGVFLVSVKIIIMSYKNSILSETLNAQLMDIRAIVERIETNLPSKDWQESKKTL